MSGLLKIFSGSGHRELAELVMKKLGHQCGELSTRKFSNGETIVDIHKSVRDQDVFILQTATEPVNDMLMELLIIIKACKTASARNITAVLPCFPYARQDKKDRSRAPITAKLVADILEIAGCQHIITMDLHASQIQGFFNVPVDNVRHDLTNTSVQYTNRYTSFIVSPDAGGAKRATSLAGKLGKDTKFVIIHKEREVANEVSRMILVGDVTDKLAIIVDDIADTCGTLALAAQTLKDNGATKCVAIVTHGFLSGKAVEVIKESVLEKVVVANTLPLSAKAATCHKIEQIDISEVLAEAIRRTHNGESISELFN